VPGRAGIILPRGRERPGASLPRSQKSLILS